MNWNHPILGDALTIPDGIWQAFLTIIGAVIGAYVADRVARKGERRRELLAAAYEFEVTASRLLFLVQKEKASLYSLLRKEFSELERAVFKVRFYIHGKHRSAFDSHWHNYANIENSQLQPIKTEHPETHNIYLEYAQACKTITEPLEAMLQIVQLMAK